MVFRNLTNSHALRAWLPSVDIFSRARETSPNEHASEGLVLLPSSRLFSNVFFSSRENRRLEEGREPDNKIPDAFSVGRLQGEDFITNEQILPERRQTDGFLLSVSVHPSDICLSGSVRWCLLARALRSTCKRQLKSPKAFTDRRIQRDLTSEKIPWEGEFTFRSDS